MYTWECEDMWRCMDRCALPSWRDKRAALQSVITRSRLWLWTRALSSWLKEAHSSSHMLYNSRQTGRQADREMQAEVCRARRQCICLFVSLSCACCPTGPYWRAVLKMAHIHPLNMRTADWRIRPDNCHDVVQCIMSCCFCRFGTNLMLGQSGNINFF